MDFHNEYSSPKKCGKSHCKTPIPVGYQYKQCHSCRERQRGLTQQHRARQKASEAARVLTGSKRPRENGQALEARPLKRVRPNCNGHEENTDSDENEDFFGFGTAAAESYVDADDFFHVLRAQFKASADVEFDGTYSIAVDKEIEPKQRTHMVMLEIWHLTGYRFTVHDNKALMNGHRTRSWCSQDQGHKKKAKPSSNLEAKHRDCVGMKRYPCRSRLTITCRQSLNEDQITINLRHHVKHVLYVDVSMPPEALQMIQEEAEWLTPAAMASKIQSLYPQVTTKQIHAAWREICAAHWRRDDAQLPSAKKLLAEFAYDTDIFEPRDMPEGVEMLAWGMKRIAERLRGKVLEIGMDATYNTNSKHLELYSIMGEYDNAGFPLAYCLLSTATAIDQGKRTKALTAWACCLRDKYGVDPVFVHTDKDMAEIGCAEAVWDAKINLCWWHLRRAVKTRLAKKKLSTTPYNINRAISEYAFISADFFPPGTRVDAEDYEGGAPGPDGPAHVIYNPSPSSNQLPAGPREPSIAQVPLVTNSLRITLPLAHIRSAVGAIVSLNPTTLLPTSEEQRNFVAGSDKREVNIEGQVAGDGDGITERRTFCPTLYLDPIVKMMEQHYCAHPTIPGYSPPDARGIKRWAVQQIYNFCVKHELPEVWVYLWENWYRCGRWKLWARSTHALIPVLKTTMIVESHWRRIKHDFLRHFHLPRCDLLVWILVTKLAPTYYRKLDLLLIETGRYRELSSWRKGFKKIWRKLEKTPITIPLNDAYRPNVQKWICTCPSFAVSRFLICKHLIQSIPRVPAIFFLEAKRYRELPFWRHSSLRPLDESHIGLQNLEPVESDESDGGTDSDSEEEGEDGVETYQDERTFEEIMMLDIDLIESFAKGLRYQVQFSDQRMLNTLHREGTSFLRLAKACMDKEKRMNSTRSPTMSTWEKSTSAAMFYHARTTDQTT